MITLRFEIHGGGDYSVGLWDVHSSIIIRENLHKTQRAKVTKEWKEMLADYYDVPISLVMTDTEYKGAVNQISKEPELP